MKTFPIMLDMQDKLAVVIGGGSVGLRKVDALLAAGICVRLVAEEIAGLAPSGEGLEVLRQPYEPNQLAGATLVLACTDDRKLNARIAAEARAAGALVNVADQPEDCDFHMPAIVRDGNVVLAVASGGSAPGVAAMLARRLAPHMPPRIGEFAAALAAIRDELKTLLPAAGTRMGIMKELSGDEGYALFAAGGSQALHRRLDELLKQARERDKR